MITSTSPFPCLQFEVIVQIRGEELKIREPSNDLRDASKSQEGNPPVKVQKVRPSIFANLQYRVFQTTE